MVSNKIPFEEKSIPTGTLLHLESNLISINFSYNTLSLLGFSGCSNGAACLSISSSKTYATGSLFRPRYSKIKLINNLTNKLHALDTQL